jgi:hypothetical protein
MYVVGAVLSVALFAAALIDAREAPMAFVVVAAAAAITYVVGLALLPRARWTRRRLTIALVLAALWRLPLLARDPTLSTDVYRYIWDGRVQRARLNPYTSTPSDPALQRLHTPATRKADHVTLRAVYPPGAELFFRGVTAIHESPFALKLALVACEALTVWLLLAWPTDPAKATMAALAFAWNPTAAIEVAGSGHVDALGVLALVACAVALRRERPAAAALLFALAISVKFLPAILFPLFWRRVRVRDGVLAAAALLALYLPFRHAGALLPAGSIGVWLQSYRFNSAPFLVLESQLGAPLALGAALGLGVAAAAFARRRLKVDDPAAWAWPLAIALLFMPNVYPWYLLWVTPFLGARATLPAGVWSVSVLVTYAVWASMKAGAGWTLPAWVTAVEFGAPAAALVLLPRRARQADKEPDDAASG